MPSSEQDSYWTSTRVALVLLLGALVVAAVGYGGTHLSANRIGPVLNPAGTAAVPGDCVTAGAARLVDCTDSAARFAVIESFPGSTDLDRCADVPGTEYALVQHIRAASAGNVLCVEPVSVTARWQGE